MYTFAPLANVNTVNSHVGLIIISVGIIAAYTLIAIWADEDLKVKDTWLGVVLVAIAAAFSFTTGEIINYANTPVTGTLVEFQPEGYNIKEQSGKSTRDVDHHILYVVYQVDNSLVTFAARTGVEYPKEVVLYKN